MYYYYYYMRLKKNEKKKKEKFIPKLNPCRAFCNNKNIFILTYIAMCYVCGKIIIFLTKK